MLGFPWGERCCPLVCVSGGRAIAWDIYVFVHFPQWPFSPLSFCRFRFKMSSSSSCRLVCAFLSCVVGVVFFPFSSFSVEAVGTECAVFAACVEYPFQNSSIFVSFCCIFHCGHVPCSSSQCNAGGAAFAFVIR